MQISAPVPPTSTSTSSPAGASAPLPPLQERTPEQLRDGMVVKVKGAGSEDLAAARLIQDGAQYMARAAGTTMGLGTVEFNYGPADMQGALGLATFHGTSGWFALSKRSTSGLLEGIERLRTTPWAGWSEAQRQAFVQANETILHEAAHVTLNGYTSEDVRAWGRADRAFEEGVSEVATMTHIADFMRDEFGVDIGSVTDRISQSASAYTRYSERIERLVGMGTDGSPAAIARAASEVGDGVLATDRAEEVARRIGANLGGADAPAAIVDEIATTIPGFIQEKNGTRTKLMELQAALVDHRAGRPVDVDAVLAAARELDGLAGETAIEPVGTQPIA